jgi:hypothetical protein
MLTSDPIGEAPLDFTLKHAGPVLSGRSTYAKEKKSDLRYEFHKQLALLWRVHPYLKTLDPGTFARQPARKQRMDDIAPAVHYETDLYYRCLLGGIDYVPIVSYGHRMHCQLAIRLHSRRSPGGIIHQGADLDNRLKVIVDALRMPDPGQDTEGAASDGEEALMFCLLENDDLVTKLSIETFQLLSEDLKTAEPEYVEVDIDVHVVPVAPRPFNYPLLFP